MIIGAGEIEITYRDWFAYSQNKFEYKIDKFIKKLNKINLLRRNENEEQIEKRNIQSERYDRQNRKEAYEVWSQNSEDERQSRSSLYHYLSIAEKNDRYIPVRITEYDNRTKNSQSNRNSKDQKLSRINNSDDAKSQRGTQYGRYRRLSNESRFKGLRYVNESNNELENLKKSKIRKSTIDNFDYIVESNIDSDINTLNDYISSINNINIGTKNFNIEQDYALEYELNVLLENIMKIILRLTQKI